jgi:heat shock protein 5
MVREAEENAEMDRIAKENIEAKNQLESYLYNVRSSVSDGLKDKISEEDKNTVNEAVSGALHWLEEHLSESKSVYEEKKKEVEQVVSPIISKAYGASPSDKAEDTSSEESTSSAESAEE